jgi:hypothetical protein
MIAWSLANMHRKSNPPRFIPYSEIAHKAAHKARATDNMTADQIKQYIADKL